MPELNPPDLQIFSGNTDEWGDYQNGLYQIFHKTLITDKPTFQGLSVTTRFLPSTNGKHFTFWHLISEGEIEEERTPDLRRCERVSWIGWLIKNCNHPNIFFWESGTGKRRATIIWCEKLDFAIILSKRSNSYLLKTAYSGLSQHKIKTWKKEYLEYSKAQKS